MSGLSRHQAPAAPGGSFGSASLAEAQRSTERHGLEQQCVQHGLKMTGQRRVIARVLSDAGDHPDVEELYRRAVLLDPRISIATVYRTVRLLEEKGILHRRNFGGTRARYEPTDHGQHHHLIDVETGRVIEFKDAEHETLIRDIARKLGFDLVSLRLELFGRRRDPLPEHASPAEAPRRPAQPAPPPIAPRLPVR